MNSNAWWRSAVVYQVYPRSFADASGDGIGDLPGIADRLPAIAELGVDAIWLSPYYPSPQHDAGYDVADYTDVDPRLGSLADVDRILTGAHALGMRVLVDLVPNHSSWDHPWFRAALASAPGSPERARYLFRDGKGPGGDEPPNNWQSVFGGPAWERVTEADGTPGQWYLHLFDRSQPDLDWTDPEVVAFFDDVLRFWLDRGVDGFRVDVANAMAKAPGLPDVAPTAGTDRSGSSPMWEQPEVHDIIRHWRTITDSYPGQRILTGEAWVFPVERLAAWVRPDEMHQAFNFPFLEAPFEATELRRVVQRSLDAFGSVDAPSTWVLSNHDVVRHASRLVMDPLPIGGLRRDHAAVTDPARGVRVARAATAVMLALPGSAYLFQGEELGLPEVFDIPDALRQDPTFARSGGEHLGRDGCRVPIPWTADAPAFGFNATGESWLPQPASWAAFARDAQRGVAGSTLEFYRAALATRRAEGLGGAALEWTDAAPAGVLGFRVGAVRVWANTTADAVPLPEGDVLLASGPLQGEALPAETTVWIRG
ncbi:MAG: glycoside hydrolase family 13 protein [Micrococcales bacterium]|nr:glycoside hydrolase family 13 protein [Micrococcales bacterium]